MVSSVLPAYSAETAEPPHYNIPSFVSEVEAQGIQIMVSMAKMDCSGPFVPDLSLMFIWDNNTLFVLFLQLTMARTKLRLSSYIRKRKGIGVRNIPAKKIKNDSLSNKIYLPPSTTKKTHKCQICEKLHVKFQNHRLKHSYLVKKLMIWFVIVIMTLINIQTPVQN